MAVVYAADGLEICRFGQNENDALIAYFSKRPWSKYKEQAEKDMDKTLYRPFKYWDRYCKSPALNKDKVSLSYLERLKKQYNSNLEGKKILEKEGEGILKDLRLPYGVRYADYGKDEVLTQYEFAASGVLGMLQN